MFKKKKKKTFSC